MNVFTNIAKVIGGLYFGIALMLLGLILMTKLMFVIV